MSRSSGNRGGPKGVLDAGRPSPETRPRLPLVVDLDGTLTPTDTLLEGLLQSFKANPFVLPKLLRSSMSGRLALKTAVAASSAFDPAAIPYNAELLDYIRAERSAGRSVFLASATVNSIAMAVADHVGLFDEVFASTEVRNLKGDVKARFLEERFGKTGFVYAGNSRVDLPVWRAANAAIVVEPPPRLLREVESLVHVERAFLRPSSRWRVLMRSLRPHQWAKNLLIFVPAALSHQLAGLPTLLAASLAFVAFSLSASGVYLLNDLADLDVDREHRTKRKRPFARSLSE